MKQYLKRIGKNYGASAFLVASALQSRQLSVRIEEINDSATTAFAFGQQNIFMGAKKLAKSQGKQQKSQNKTEEN